MIEHASTQLAANQHRVGSIDQEAGLRQPPHFISFSCDPIAGKRLNLDIY